MHGNNRKQNEGLIGVPKKQHASIGLEEQTEKDIHGLGWFSSKSDRVTGSRRYEVYAQPLAPIPTH